MRSAALPASASTTVSEASTPQQSTRTAFHEATKLAPRPHSWRVAAVRADMHRCSRPAVGSGEPLGVQVLIVNMFSLEAAPWVHALHDLREIRVPGPSADYPAVSCDPRAVCQMTTGMGHANAAASMMAVLYSGLFDLRQTYVIVAGIAGIDPLRGTIGSVAWARYVVDMGIAHELDAREIPRDWRDGYFGVMTDGPGKTPRFEYQTEVFQ